MTAGRDFLVLSDHWNGLPTSTIHLFRRLYRGNRVFWFNMISRPPRLSREDLRKVNRTIREWAGRLLRGGCASNGHLPRQHPTVHVTTPFVVPCFSGFFRRFNRASLLLCYRTMRRRHGIQFPIVFTTWPPAVDFLRSITGVKIYYCVDEWTDYPGLNAADWRRMESELLDNIDGFVATSRPLAAKSRPGCASLYLPHGVDFDHFRRGHEEPRSVPTMERIARPIVGFFGFIGPWIDLGIVVELSKSFSEVSFVLIGKTDTDIGVFSGIPNVHYLGPVSYSELPRYARYFDVGLIPFARSHLTAAVNPLKLMEYYALGLPVLATRLPELEQIGGAIELAVGKAEFCQKLRFLLDNRSALCRQEAVAVAERNTWESRAVQLSQFLEGLLTSKLAALIGTPEQPDA